MTGIRGPPGPGFAALNNKVQVLGDEVLEEIEEVEDTKDTMNTVTIIGVVWIILITIILAIIGVFVCLRLRKSKNKRAPSDSDSDAEFAIDGMSEKSSVVDFEFDIDDLGEVFKVKRKSDPSFTMANGDKMHDIMKDKPKQKKEKQNGKKKKNIKENFRKALMNNGGKPWSGFYFPEPGTSNM